MDTIVNSLSSQKPITNSSTTDQEKKETSTEKNHDEDTKQHTRCGLK